MAITIPLSNPFLVVALDEKLVAALNEKAAERGVSAVELLIEVVRRELEA